MSREGTGGEPVFHGKEPERDDGGPFHPFAPRYTGITLRDWFAGQALAGIVTQLPADIGLDLANGIRGGKNISAASYALADAMIAERSKP